MKNLTNITVGCIKENLNKFRGVTFRIGKGCNFLLRGEVSLVHRSQSLDRRHAGADTSEHSLLGACNSRVGGYERKVQEVSGREWKTLTFGNAFKQSKIIRLCDI
jgi:hypothetical protein